MRPDLWRSFIFGGVNITGFQMAYDNTYLHLMQTQLNMPPGKSPSVSISPSNGVVYTFEIFAYICI